MSPFEEYAIDVRNAVRTFAETEPEGRMILAPLIDEAARMAANLIVGHGLDPTEVADMIHHEMDIQMTSHIQEYIKNGTSGK